MPLLPSHYVQRFVQSRKETGCNTAAHLWQFGFPDSEHFITLLEVAKLIRTAALNCHRIILLISNYELLIRNYRLLIRNYELLIRIYGLLIRNYELLIRRYELVIRNYELVIRNYELVIRNYELVIRNYELRNRPAALPSSGRSHNSPVNLCPKSPDLD